MLDFTDQVVLVTGAGSGIGAAVAGVPMGRMGTPEECVGTELFLASSATSGYVTGQVIEVNGGQLTP